MRLISGVDYRGAHWRFITVLHLLTDWFIPLGLLSCLDGYMNIALEQTEEHVNGTVTNRYGDAFIRGNNGAYISLVFVGTHCPECPRVP